MKCRLLQLLASLSLSLILMLGFASCGGGGSNPTQGVPAASLSASAVSFAGQAVGAATPAVGVTLTNSGSAALSITSFSITGTNSGEFSQTNNCGSNVAAGGSCTVTLTFNPTTTGSRTALLSVTDNAAGSPQTISLGGAGISSQQATLGTLGTAAGASTACSAVNGTSGVSGATCYVVTVSNCPGVADQDVWVKVNNPSGTQGTVTFLTGGGGTPWYDEQFVFGTNVVNNVVQAGFTTAQINFGAEPTGFPVGGTQAGWLTGAGGVRALSCRFSTASKWIYDHIRQPGAPFCHTGNSAGSAAPAYSLAYHGFDAYYNYLELTSGPPFTRIDKGCICQPPNSFQTQCGQGLQDECYLNYDGSRYVDPAYGPTTHSCTDSMAGTTTYQQQFYNDSLANPNATYSFPNVVIHFVFGGLDTGSAEPQGQEWIDGGSVSPDGTFTAPAISGKGGVTQACVATAPHAIADDQAGALTIANDVIANCH